MLVTQSSGKFLKRKHSLLLGEDLLDLTHPCVMGVINLTPDSFYDGGLIKNETELLEKVEQMMIDGASVIDLGAVSTRPGSEPPPLNEELDRLLPAVKSIHKYFPEIPISIDTYRSWIAVRVFEEVGPIIVNDISGGTLDSKMFETIGLLKIPYILTHMQGSPKTMQDNPTYTDVVREVAASLSEGVRQLTKAGAHEVMIDPGFGFGKTVMHNYQLLNRLDALKVYQLPVVVGVSRKSMIWKVLETDPGDALNGTTVLNTMALLGGADLLRVHDVKEAVDAIRLFLQLKDSLDA